MVIFFLYILATSVAYCESSCEYPWIQIGENSKCYLVSHDPVTYYEADMFCKQSGGFLAEPRSAEETKLLDEFCLPELNYWIGLTDLAKEGTFVWGSDYSEPVYTSWLLDQPNGDGDCVERAAANGGYGFHWADCDCDLSEWTSYPTHAICQRDV